MSQEIDVLFKLSGNSVIPIGLYVPRKKKVYEAELYPDTASLTPSLVYVPIKAFHIFRQLLTGLEV